MRFVEFFIPNVLDLICLILFVTVANTVITAVSNKHHLGRDKGLLTKVYYYHLLFAFIYMLYILNNGGDSIGYWREPTRFIPFGAPAILLLKPGSSFIHFLTYPFSQILGLSLWGGTVIFSTIGYFGFVCIYLTCRKMLSYNPTLFGYRLLPLILFLPNMHFWSAGVGKDTVIFFALALFVYSLTNLKSNAIWLGVAFFLMFFIRPHIGFVCLVAFGCALLLSSKGVPVFVRVGFIVATVVLFVFVSPVVFSFIGVEQESIETYEDVAAIRSKNLSRGSVGSSIAMSSYPLPLKMFTFLFRPLFLDGGGLFGLAVSIENAFYLALTLSLFRMGAFRELLKMPMAMKVCLLVVAATSFFMSSSLSNLGIIIRQKNMVMFMLVLVVLYVSSELTRKNQSKRFSRPTRTIRQALAVEGNE